MGFLVKSEDGQSRPMFENYQLVAGSESVGGRFPGAIRIEVDLLRDLTEEDRFEARRAAEKLMSALHRNAAKRDPQLHAEREQMVASLLSCFPCQTSHTLAPNGYCPDYCCEHLPWLKVATYRGFFVIGWRKRVISIDWADTNIQARGSEVFPGAAVTVGERYIHAWSYENARTYIEKLLTA